MEIFIAMSALALALAMDAFAVALAQGASGRTDSMTAVRLGFAFGVAQAVMPLIGWLLGTGFAALIQTVDHWIALILLSFLGLRMIREALTRDEGEVPPALSGWTLLTAAIATSIDALVAGITIPTLGLPILLTCLVIGVATTVLCAIGVRVGGLMGARLGTPAELFGGAVLILLGLDIFIRHQFFGG
mgnify:CR=1 FL=1